MASQQLTDYIKQRLAQGATKAEIKSALAEAGWLQSDIEAGFREIESPSPITQSSPTVPSVESAPQTASPVQPFSIFSAQIPKQKSKLPVIIIAAVGLFLIGGGAFAYYYFNTPQMVLKRMMAAEEKVKSVEFQGEISMEITGGKDFNALFGQQGKMTMNFSGSSDMQDVAHPKASLYFDMEAAGSSLFTLEMRQIDKMLYLKVADAPMLEMFGLNSVIGQWIKIDTKELAQQPGLEDLGKNLDQELTPEKIEQINKIFQKSMVIKEIEKMPDENIEGVDTRHYKLAISRDELKKFLIDAMAVIDDKSLTSEEIKQLDDDFKDLESLAGEVWIGKKDLLLRKISFHLKGKQQDPSIGEIGVEYDINVLLRNYDKPVQIEVPSPTKNFEEIFGPLFMGIFTGSTTTLPSF